MRKRSLAFAPCLIAALALAIPRVYAQGSELISAAKGGGRAVRQSLRAWPLHFGGSHGHNEQARKSLAGLRSIKYNGMHGRSLPKL